MQASAAQGNNIHEVYFKNKMLIETMHNVYINFKALHTFSLIIRVTTLAHIGVGL